MITNELSHDLIEQLNQDLMILDTSDKKVFIELFLDEKVTLDDVKKYMKGNKILNKYYDIAEELYLLSSHERIKEIIDLNMMYEVLMEDKLNQLKADYAHMYPLDAAIEIEEEMRDTFNRKHLSEFLLKKEKEANEKLAKRTRSKKKKIENLVR